MIVLAYYLKDGILTLREGENKDELIKEIKKEYDPKRCSCLTFAVDYYDYEMLEYKYKKLKEELNNVKNDLEKIIDKNDIL